MNVTFKNLERSDLAIDACEKRIIPLLDKFPTLNLNDIQVTLCMDNSPIQGGLDVFGVTVKIKTGPYQGVVLKKSAPTMYSALAMVIESIHERMKRFDEKNRTVRRQQGRNKKQKFINEVIDDEMNSISA